MQLHLGAKSKSKTSLNGGDIPLLGGDTQLSSLFWFQGLRLLQRVQKYLIVFLKIFSTFSYFKSSKSATKMFTYFLLSVLISTFWFSSSIECRRSCRESGLCCPGRDSSCLIQGSKVNVILKDPYDRPCYCDHACITLGDCCYDYKQTCAGNFSFLLTFYFILL